jgi:lipopolysaccharide O-acetyltransferase
MMSLQKLVRTYGYWGILRLLSDYLLTKVLFPGARLVRRPVYVRGKANIRWGKRLTTGIGVRLDVFCSDSEQRLFFGDDVQLNDYVHIGAVQRVEIGSDVLIASKVFISDHNHGGYNELIGDSEPFVPPLHRPLVAKPVFIGDRVWIGEQACILPGVKIGEGAIVGAGSVVTRDVPANSIVAGNPARILRVFNAESGAWQRI